MNRIYKKLLLANVWLMLAFLLSITLVVSPIGLALAQSAHGTMSLAKDDSKKVLITLQMGNLRPNITILSLHLPEGYSLTDAHPKISSISKNGKEIKWLLKGLKAGATTITVILNKPVSDLGQFKAILRYKVSGQEAVTDIKIAK